MECVKNPEINCAKDPCPDTHSCCFQDTGQSSKPTLGICVKKDEKGGESNCDKNRGLPVKGCKDRNNKYNITESYEKILVKSKEGYNDRDNCDCDDWKNAFSVLFIIIILLLIIASIFYIKSRKNKFI